MTTPTIDPPDTTGGDTSAGGRTSGGHYIRGIGPRSPLILAPVAGDILASIATHRLVSSQQLHTLHTPGNSVQWRNRQLDSLRRHKHITWVGTRRRQGRLWYLTRVGAEAVQPLPAFQNREVRWLTRAQAASHAQAHTLAVNEVGVQLVRWARLRDHDIFGPLSWQNEVGHRFTDGQTRQGVLAADGLIRYDTRLDDGRLVFATRFLELDRGSESVQQLGVKLANYLRLFSYTPKGASEEGWRLPYRQFPGVLVVFDGKDRKALESRLQRLVQLYRADPVLSSQTDVWYAFGLLSDLAAKGPHAPVFFEPKGRRRVNLFGQIL